MLRNVIVYTTDSASLLTKYYVNLFLSVIEAHFSMCLSCHLPPKLIIILIVEAPLHVHVHVTLSIHIMLSFNSTILKSKSFSYTGHKINLLTS